MGKLQDIINHIRRAKNLDLDQAKELARHEDREVRQALASREDLQPELLYFLAEDPDPSVRRTIAGNESTPRQADILLACDNDESVRSDLTEKIARLAPGLSANEKDRVRKITYEALMILCHDQVTRVRQILAEALKDVADAPPEVIGRLARDAEALVSGPILRFSPVLSDQDLLDIISQPPNVDAFSSIAARHNVSVTISDAIIASDHEAAITALLSNSNAQIREETLDLLAERARNVEAWHRPLSKRPVLSITAVRKMAEYLADALIDDLKRREDLPPQTLQAVEEVVKRRLSEPQPPVDNRTPDEVLQEEIQQLCDNGELNEAIVETWLEKSDKNKVIIALAVLSKIDRVIVKKILNSHSPKGILALAWRAGLSIAFAESLQLRLAKIPYDISLKATTEGEYPLTEDELSWHLELFT